MAEGATFKRCTCRDPDSGKRLGAACGLLQRRGGGWSATHGSWYYQLELPPRADGARRGPLRRGGYTSKTDAEAELDRARDLIALSDELDTQIQVADLIIDHLKVTKVLPDVEAIRRKIRTRQELNRTVLLRDWLEEFLKRKRSLAQTTLRSYESHIRLYFTPYLGHIPIDRLRVSDISDMFDAIEETNEIIRQARATGNPELRAKVKGQRVSGPSSQLRYLATLRHALNLAMRQERLIDFNPASAIELPAATRPKPLVWTPERTAEWQADFTARLAAARQRRPGRAVDVIEIYLSTPRPSPVMVWTPDQTTAFLTYATRHRLFALYRLIALRGLRRGEACGIRTREVHLDAATLEITWQITQLGWTTIQGKPKTDASDRTVALDAATVRALRAYQAGRRRERLAAGASWTSSGFFFTTDTGHLLHPAHVTEQFHWLSYEAGLPPIRLHDLRHGAASLMLAAGVDLKVVAETLGHTSTTFTRDTYTSVFPEVAKAAAESTAALLTPLRGTP